MWDQKWKPGFLSSWTPLWAGPLVLKEWAPRGGAESDFVPKGRFRGRMNMGHRLSV